MTPLAAEILDKARQAGTEAYLWIHDSGDVILWPDKTSSVDDDGRHAIARWQVDEETAQDLFYEKSTAAIMHSLQIPAEFVPAASLVSVDLMEERLMRLIKNARASLLKKVQMAPDEYFCEGCREVFKKGVSDEEANAERTANGLDNVPVAIVCDDCYKKIPQFNESTDTKGTPDNDQESNNLPGGSAGTTQGPHS